MTQTNAITCLVLGIISLFTAAIPPLGIILAIIGIFFYYRQKKIRKEVMATIGLVLCIIGIVLSILFTIHWILLIRYFTTV